MFGLFSFGAQPPHSGCSERDADDLLQLQYYAEVAATRFLRLFGCILVVIGLVISFSLAAILLVDCIHSDGLRSFQNLYSYVTGLKNMYIVMLAACSVGLASILWGMRFFFAAAPQRCMVQEALSFELPENAGPGLVSMRNVFGVSLKRSYLIFNLLSIVGPTMVNAVGFASALRHLPVGDSEAHLFACFIPCLEFFIFAFAILNFVVIFAKYVITDPHVANSLLPVLSKWAKFQSAFSSLALLKFGHTSFPRFKARLHNFSKVVVVQLIIAFLCVAVGVVAILVKVQTVQFVLTQNPLEWKFSQWVACALFINNAIHLGGDMDTLKYSGGLLMLMSFLQLASCNEQITQQWLFKFRLSLLNLYGRSGAFIVMCNISEDHMGLLLNSRKRVTPGC